MRLDKYIANNSEYSRSEIRKLAKAGRIEINQHPTCDPSCKINPLSDTVEIDKHAITAVGDVYIMLNKPQGVVCANSDGQHPTVIDCLFDALRCKDDSFDINHLYATELQIVGRLDIDTTGLVLITNNGKWNHQVTAPASHCDKCYLVETADPIEDKAVKRFENGLLLDGEKKKTKPAKLEILSRHSAHLIIAEGKYHQVKRMFGALGNRVTSLHRVSIGNITLDEHLELGEYRCLSQHEAEGIFDK